MDFVQQAFEETKLVEAQALDLDKPKITGEAIAIIGRARFILEQVKDAPAIENDSAMSTTQASLKTVSDMIRQLETIRLNHTRPIDAMKKAIMNFFRGAEDDLGAAKQKMSGLILDYNKIVEAKRAAEEERLRVAAADEAKRLDDEQKKLEEAAKKKREAAEAEIAAANVDEKTAEGIRDQAEHEAGQLEQEASFKEVEAESVKNVVVSAPAPVKTTGVIFKVTWKAEVTSLEELVKGIAAGTTPIEAIKADLPFLNSQARAFKSKLNYPGVAAVSSKSVSS